MIKRLLLALALCLPWYAHADWAADRDGSLVYAPVTVLASAVDEAVPFFIVYGSDLDAAFHAAMDAAGDTTGETLRASNADGTTQIACWPVGVNTSSDTFALFVRGDTMSASTDTDFRIYAGNSALSLPAVTDTYGRNAVFSGYAGVYLPGMSTDDFTGSGRNLTAVNSPGTAASSMEGITAATYNGTTQYHGYSGTQGVTNWPITLECVAYSATNTSTRAAFSISDVDLASNNLVDIRFAGATTGDPIKFTPFGATGSVGDADSTTGYTVNTWHYAAGTRDSNSTPGDSFAYIDGGSQGTNAANVQTPTDFDRLTVGGKVSSSINYFNGRVAIALLSGSVRSANYVSTMQDVWSGALYTAGASVELGSGLSVQQRTSGFFVLAR